MNSLRWPMWIWQLFGMAPFKFVNKSSLSTKNTQLQYYTITLLLFHFILLIIAIFFSSTFINWSPVSYINYDNFLSMLSIRLVACIIVAEAIFKLNKQIEFFRRIIRVDHILSHKLRIEIDYKKEQIQNNILTAVWIVMCFVCIICVLIALNTINISTTTGFWLWYSVSFTVYSIHYHRIVLYVHLILLRYKSINQFIEKVCSIEWKKAESPEYFLAFKQMSQVGYDRIEQPMTISQLADIRKAYQILYETTDLINDMFRWSLPLCIGIDFHQLVVNFYLTFVVLLMSTEWNALLMNTTWGIINIGHLICLSHACHCTRKEVSL